MKKFSKPLSVLLSVFLILSAVPFCLAEDESGFDPQITLCKNSGAVITGTEVMTASCDSELVTVESAGDTVTVTANDGAVGIAKVTVSDGQSSKAFEIPVGYTTFEFSDNGITVYEGSDTKYEITGINSQDEETSPETETGSDGSTLYKNGDGYSLNVAIKAKGGTYVFLGQSDDASICVKKEASSPTVLLFAGLDLTSSFTSPLTVKKDSSSSVTVNALEGFENTLSDSELNNADLYGDTSDGGDGTNAAYAESAVIKGKVSANITLTGKGVLNLNCATKNAIKLGTSGVLTVESLTLNIVSANHGISCDNIININSGSINITASGDGFNPGGGRPGQGGPGGNPGGNGGSAPGQGGSSDYTINIYGGEIFVNAEGDGLDSNGDLNLLGGSLVIWGMKAGGDNEPLDCDGTLTIDGATVFGAGSSAMTTVPKSSQGYITSRASAASGKTVNILQNGETVFKIKAVKNINYVIYSSPDVTDTSEWSIVIDDSSLEDDYYALGDVNLDGRITSSDTLLALQASVGKITLESARQNAADVDKDGSVTATDALLILQYSVGKISSF